MRGLLLRLFLRFMPSMMFMLTEQEKKSRMEWLIHSHGSEGFRAYFVSRDYALLKTMGNGLENKEYWVAMGRRLELLHLLGEAKNHFDKNNADKKSGAKTLPGDPSP